MSKVKIYLFLQFVFFFSVPVFAQVDSVWVRRYNGPGNDVDQANAVAVDASGNVYVTGVSGSGASSDYATIKYAPNGDTLWVRRYNGPGNSGDHAFALALDGSGDVYVTGYSWSVTSTDYATIKYAPNGDTLWVRRYNGPGNVTDQAQALALDGNGNLYVTGYSWGSGTSYDYATIKYAPNGDTLWVRRYNGPGNGTDGAYALALDGSGNLYVTGWSYGSGTSSDYATIKYAPNGDTLWVRRYNGPGNSEDIAYALALDGSGNINVTGESPGSGTFPDYATIKYAPNGDTLWVRRYNGPGNSGDYAYALALDGSGNVYVTGYSNGSGTSSDYATIKYAPNGDTLWVKRYNGPGNGTDEARSLALDGSGNVYVTGYSIGSGTSGDYATIKYAPNGDTLWVRRYNGPSNNLDYAYALALDGSGNVYVTGFSYGSGTSYDYATIKYGIPPPLPSDSGKNHYKTWRVGQTFLGPFTVFVQDQFMQDSLSLNPIEFLSNPARKVVGVDTFDIIKPNNHLTWYRAAGRDTLLEVEYVNQFESTTVLIDSVHYFLLPTQKLPHAPPDSLDHYKCYRIRNPQAIIVPIELQDQFDLTPELIDSLTPLYFCAPAQKNSEPMYDTLTHYVAYLIKPQRDTFVNTTTVDQFGSFQLSTLNSEMVLVPTKKLSVTVPTPLPSDYGKNHYKTWRIQTQPLDTVVFVQDQFMQDTLRLDSIKFLSNPAQKIVGIDTFNIRKPDDHLNWYRARGRDTLLKVEYVNQFESTSVQIDSVKYLLVPAQKYPHNPPDSLDHYKCYRIRNAQKLVRPVELLDQFDMYYPELIDTLVPLYFCTPAQKNNEPKFDTLTHYIAYLIKPQRSISDSRNTIDQFGYHFMVIDTSKILLVPTKKLKVTVPPAPPSDYGKNHYKTWRIQPQPLDTSVFVQDQFRSDTLTLDTIDFLSNPVQKVVDNGTSGIKKPDDHLNWYRAIGQRNDSLQVEYVNQFESTTVKIDSVKYLLVPAQKLPHPAPESLDHYKCYRIKDTLQFIRQFRLKDQFDSLYQANQFEVIDSLKRVYFCTPCRKNNEPVYDTVTHYVAYSFVPDTLSVAPILGTLDQFGPHPVQVYQSEMVLVPTMKKHVGPLCTYKPGDVDGNGRWTLTDIIALVNIVFKGAAKPTPLCRTDANGTGGNPNLPDIIVLVNYVFKGGPAPVKIGVCCL